LLGRASRSSRPRPHRPHQSTRSLAGLSLAGVEFSAAGELAEGPFTALGRAGGRIGRTSGGGNGGFRTPVRRSGMDTPDIAGFVERYTYHPPLTSGTERHTVGDASGHTLAAGQFVQGDCESRFQGARNPYTAALRIKHERVSGLGERGCRVQAGDANRNLGADAGAVPSRVNRFFRGVHCESFLMILRSSGDCGRVIAGRDVHQSNSVFVGPRGASP
jgi:hypothetical protein